MLIGYTLLDPLIVLLGTCMALYFLVKRPIRLMSWLPAALTIYFFIPLTTLLTLWQTVPMLLTGRIFLKRGLCIAPSARPVMWFLLLAFLLSSCYALVAGSDGGRAAIRVVYYAGVFALMSFSYEMARRPECYEMFLKGLALTGGVFAAYAAYQILASHLGLPMRGIVRGIEGSQLAYESGILRVNSFASEPKRLGYVLFVGGMAAMFLIRIRPELQRMLKFMGYGAFLMSLFTLSGSYFFAIFLFTVAALFLYPSGISKYLLGLVVLVIVVIFFFPELGLLDAIQQGYERRNQELEVGLDGTFVYRQEFYAWNYLERFPYAAVFGVGLGQYFSVLNKIYGVGVGINEYGGLLPLNSTFLELTFDFGGVTAFLFYVALVGLIFKLRRAGETYLCLALLFVTVQSFTILTLLYIALFAGVGVARLAKGKS